MSNNKDSNTSNKTELKFNEFQAYEELRLIFVIAIETQNFERVPSQIAAWEKKYPLAEFTDPEIIRKIKALLDKDYLNDLIGKYLADQILHVKEKQTQAYNLLQTIITSAKKNKDYATAQRKIVSWKASLKADGLSLYDFAPMYKRKICTLLLIPGRELKNQDSALRDLKQLKEKGSSLDSKTYSREISDWQNKYCIKKFPDKLQKELNSITTEVFQSISIKTTEEAALKELESYVADSQKSSTPLDDITSILSKYDYNKFSIQTQNQISKLTSQALSIQDAHLENDETISNILSQGSITSVQLTALNDLKDIMAKDSHNSDVLLNWIYVNRKVNFSEFARNQIIAQFASAGYKIPTQSSYYIPEISIDPLAINNSEFEAIRKNVIVNYLGILSKGNSLSKYGKENIVAIHTTSATTENLKNAEIILPVFDNVPEINSENVPEISSENEMIDKDTSEEDICNIIIEDIINDPLTTYSISSVPIKAEKEDSLDDSLKSTQASLPNFDAIDLNTLKSDEPDDTLANTSEITAKPSSVEVQSSNEIQGSIELSNTASIDDDNDNDLAKTTSNFLQESNPYTLTVEDQNNIEKANDISTYIVVTAPILQMVQTNKESQLIQEQEYEEVEDEYQKNNGF